MFLLDQIDDLSSVEDIVDVTGLPAHEAYTLIRQLVDQGLVYLD
jgi:DNA-binding IclR family transcriptional regulator